MELLFIKKKKRRKFYQIKLLFLTGSLSTISREEAKKKIIENGGKISSSVSSKTDYVIAGAKPGSKYTDAQRLEVPILSEREFLKIF